MVDGMNDLQTDAQTDASRLNRGQVESASLRGCFHCLAVFPGASVSAWIDGGETALCPRCGIDSVLPGRADEAVLRDRHLDRFGETSAAA